MERGDTVWGENTGTICGFVNYVSVEECIRAYYRLMGGPTYRPLIAGQQWRILLDLYAPASDGNDTAEHWQIVQIVRSWCEERGIW
jgi:hypothetical protein